MIRNSDFITVEFSRSWMDVIEWEAEFGEYEKFKDRHPMGEHNAPKTDMLENKIHGLMGEMAFVKLNPDLEVMNTSVGDLVSKAGQIIEVKANSIHKFSYLETAPLSRINCEVNENSMRRLLSGSRKMTVFVKAQKTQSKVVLLGWLWSDEVKPRSKLWHAGQVSPSGFEYTQNLWVVTADQFKTFRCTD